MTADAPGEIHVHSSPEQEFEYDKGSTTLDRSTPSRRPARSPSSRTPSTRPCSPSWPGEHPAVPALLPQHGLGGAQDLPISRELAILGAAAAVAVSFVVLALAWRRPRYDATTSGRPAPAWLAAFVDSVWWRGLLRLVGLVALLYLIVVAVFGKDLLINPIFGIFYVWIWVGVPVASLLFGRVWKAISPFRLISAGIASVSGGEPDEGVFAYPERLGMWPAALGLFAFVWMELVYPAQRRPLAGAALVRGLPRADDHRRRAVRDTFFARADPFEVYSSLVAQAVRLGSPRRAAGAPQPAGQPRHHPGDRRA